MSASANDKFMKAGAGTVTTLSAPGKALSATSITVGSTTNYPTDTGIVFAIRQVDVNGELVAGTYTEWAGTVTSGTTLSMDAAPVYGSDQVYPAGSTTQVYIPLSSSAHNKMVDGLLVSHDQDGTLKAGAVDNAAVLASNVVETAKIKDGAVTAGKLGLVMVSAYKSGSPQSLSAGTWTLVTLNSENFDVGGNFASNKFTAPTTGYYLVSITCVIGAAGISGTANASAAIYKNGSRFQQTMTIQGSGNANTIPRLSTTALMSLTAGDYIELYAVCSEAGRYVDVGNETSLIVVQVG